MSATTINHHLPKQLMPHITVACCLYVHVPDGAWSSYSDDAKEKSPLEKVRKSMKTSHQRVCHAVLVEGVSYCYLCKDTSFQLRNSLTRIVKRTFVCAFCTFSVCWHLLLQSCHLSHKSNYKDTAGGAPVGRELRQEGICIHLLSQSTVSQSETKRECYCIIHETHRK